MRTLYRQSNHTKQGKTKIYAQKTTKKSPIIILLINKPTPTSQNIPSIQPRGLRHIRQHHGAIQLGLRVCAQRRGACAAHLDGHLDAHMGRRADAPGAVGGFHQIFASPGRWEKNPRKAGGCGVKSDFRYLSGCSANSKEVGFEDVFEVQL